MFTINFDPIIIGRRRESIVHKKYVEPLLNSSNFKYLVLNKSVKWQQEVLEFMNEIFYLSHEKLFLYELEIINKLNLIWISILKEMKDVYLMDTLELPETVIYEIVDEEEETPNIEDAIEQIDIPEEENLD